MKWFMEETAKRPSPLKEQWRAIIGNLFGGIPIRKPGLKAKKTV
jgi:hypothetical protein